MSKVNYDIWVAALLFISIVCVGLQTLLPYLAPVAIASCAIAIALITLQMRRPMNRQKAS